MVNVEKNEGTVKNMLSKAEMKAVKGGYSRFYCTIHSPRIVILGLKIQEGLDYDTCRKMHD